jgi:hypothetical protein
MKMAVFWDVTPHSLLDNDRRFRVAYCLRHQGLLIAVMMETVSLKCRSQGEIFQKTATFFLLNGFPTVGNITTICDEAQVKEGILSLSILFTRVNHVSLQ